jgi:uncharacterized protein YqjF (DUF2071 family)
MIVILQSSYFIEQVVTLLMTWEVLKYSNPRGLYLHCIFGLLASDKGGKKFYLADTSGGLQYKNITIINKTSSVIRSDTQSCGITYVCHSDYSRGVIYAPREH